MSPEAVPPSAPPPRIPRRAPASHKGDYGHLLIAGGSPGMTGAVCLAAEAALRSGAGLVTVAVVERSWPIVATKLTEAMTRPIPEAEDGAPDDGAVASLLAGPTRFDALLLGPGLGRGPGTVRLLRAVLCDARIPLVLDADALWALAEDPSLLESLPGDAILTPHPGEFARILGVPTAQVQADREGSAAGFARRHRGVLVLKGRGTIVAEGSGAWVNPTGNPGMATGGSGDVLAGIIASLRGQGWEAFEAARLGVYLHGLAGDIAAREIGEASLIASDLVRFLPAAFRSHAEEGGGWPSARS